MSETTQAGSELSGGLGADEKFAWLLTTGDGSDGSEWGVESIHATEESAKKAQVDYEAPRVRPDGSTYTFDAQIEKWPVID